jgi:glycerol-3-phosphate O-acyltransferase/dihydroxyacetone phosphate acyltransferase
MLTRLFFKLIVKTFYRDIEVKGFENLPSSSQAIFTPNHPNALMDPLLLSFLPFEYQIHFVAKAPLFKIPLLGSLMRKMGAIPVIRRFEADGEIDYSAFFNSCIETLASGGSIAIFPEGLSLPQPRMSVIKTGAARLFFLASEKSINSPIVPIGLNYEQGSIFRSRAVIWIARPLKTDDVIGKYRDSPKDAVRELTERISKALEESVFQSDNSLDRELMLHLERIYNDDQASDSWIEKLERMKQFEAGMNTLRDCCHSEINRLRRMLSRHKNLTNLLSKTDYSSSDSRPPSAIHFLLALIGLPIAAIGVLLAFLPYQLYDYMVKHSKKYDMASAATYKIAYSLFLFPVAFIVEAMILHMLFGWVVSVLFVVLIIPICYFTLYFMEWLYEGGWGIPVSFRKSRKTFQNGITHLLEEQNRDIKDLIDRLAARLDQQT